MGASGSTEAAPVSPPAPGGQLEQLSQDEFRETVRAAASKFRNLFQENKVMLFSTTYCSYCTVAKVIKKNKQTTFCCSVNHRILLEFVLEIFLSSMFYPFEFGSAS